MRPTLEMRASRSARTACPVVAGQLAGPRSRRRQSRLRRASGLLAIQASACSSIKGADRNVPQTQSAAREWLKGGRPPGIKRPDGLAECRADSTIGSLPPRESQ